MSCRLCHSAHVEAVFSKTGAWSGRSFDIYRCLACRFIFIGNPWLDYETIYSEEYYAGRGADPLVNYTEEITTFRDSVRLYEWRGIREVVGSLIDLTPDTAWLDYGCGAGGLVRYLNQTGVADALGFEQSWAVSRLRSLGVPLLDDSARGSGETAFDIVTAIEVLEHVLDPIAELRRLRQLVKPGGLLFLTTGNALPYSGRLQKWSYIVPEVHISLFEPNTLAWALEQAGFAPLYSGYGAGWTDIVRFKILKNLGRRRVSSIESVVPWSVVGRLIDRRLGVSAQPLGRAV